MNIGMTFVGRYDKELSLNAPGWTIQRLLDDHPEIRTIVSLGPNAAINENIFAFQHADRQFTLIDRDPNVLSASIRGEWRPEHIRLRSITSECLFALQKCGMADLFSVQGDRIRRAVEPTNLRHIVGEYPLDIGMEKPFDLCLAFNSLPAAYNEPTADALFEWIFHRLLGTNGIFANEWGIFQKGKTSVYRIAREPAEPHDDHVTRILRRYWP